MVCIRLMDLLIFFYFTWGYLVCLVASKYQENTKTWNLNTWYDDSVELGKDKIYNFDLTKLDKNSTVRIFVMSHDSRYNLPIFFDARQSRGINSWSLPFISINGNSYNHVSRTLCPSWNGCSNDKFTLVVSSFSNKIALTYKFIVYLESNFVIRLHEPPRTISVSPAEPAVLLYEFSSSEEWVIVEAKSNCKTCTVVSIQNSECPSVGSFETGYSGVYATMTKRVAITVKSSDIQSGKFYIVVMVEDTDNACKSQSGKINPFLPKHSNNYTDSVIRVDENKRTKNLTLGVRLLKKTSDYWSALIIPPCVFGIFYVITIIWIGYKHISLFEFWSREKVIVKKNQDDKEVLMSSPNDHGDESNLREENKNSSHKNLNVQYGSLTATIFNEENINKDQMQFSKPKVPREEVDKILRVYCWVLCTVFAFYALPVIQLVIVFVYAARAIGDQDICYHNFECARSLSPMNAFNNMYSNLGYIMMGLLFAIIVFAKRHFEKIAFEAKSSAQKKHGVPKHSGIFYAMAFVLIFEGIMSGCYHICPNYSNFQFDTAFMYITCLLCLTQLYHQRSNIIPINAYHFYNGCALAILIAVVGMVFKAKVIYIILLVVFLVAVVIGLCKISSLCKINILEFAFLLFGFVTNTIALIVLILFAPEDFGTVWLAILLINFVIYLLYYLFQNAKSTGFKDCFNCSNAYFLFSLLTWGFSIAKFLDERSDWKLSPARSREANRSCAYLDFYDEHDLSHFLSATAMFFTYMGILNFDNALDNVEEKGIGVFF